MPFLSISSRKTFTTTLSVEQAIEAVQEMLSSRQQVLFFKPKQYSGKINGKEFNIAFSTGPHIRFMTSAIAGSMKTADSTIVELKYQIPIIPMVFFMLISLASIPYDTLRELTINGVLREPTSWERFVFAFFSVGVPAVLFVLHYLHPLRILQRELRKRLRLEELAKPS